MKKLTAIFILTLLLFNWCGYRLITSLMHLEADSRMQAIIDEEAYDESELIEVRVDLQVPYQLDQPGFERYYGEVESNGRYYTYVKRKIEKGQLVLLCLPNGHKEKIAAAGQELFKQMNSLDQLPGEKGGNTLIKMSSGDFDDRLFQPDMNILPLVSKTTMPVSAEALHDTYTPVQAQPPDVR